MFIADDPYILAPRTKKLDNGQIVYEGPAAFTIREANDGKTTIELNAGLEERHRFFAAVSGRPLKELVKELPSPEDMRRDRLRKDLFLWLPHHIRVPNSSVMEALFGSEADKVIFSDTMLENEARFYGLEVGSKRYLLLETSKPEPAFQYEDDGKVTDLKPLKKIQGWYLFPSPRKEDRGQKGIPHHL